MNNVSLTGRLTRDAEVLKINDGGRSVIKFTLAVQRTYKSASDNVDADFIPVSYFTSHADKLMEHLTKGRMISVAGKISVRSHDGTDGIKRYYTNVEAGKIDFLDSKKVEAI